MAEEHAGVKSIASVPTVVEDRLRQTMVLGLPVADADKPTFYFDRQVTWADHDTEGNPWDWEATPATDDTPTSVQPICAYEFHAPLGRSGAQFSEVGDFFPSTLIVTFTETDYLLAVNSAYVTVGSSNTKYWFRYWLPAYGLANMTFYQAHFQAEDSI